MIIFLADVLPSFSTGDKGYNCPIQGRKEEKYESQDKTVAFGDDTGSGGGRFAADYSSSDTASTDHSIFHGGGVSNPAVSGSGIGRCAFWTGTDQLRAYRGRGMGSLPGGKQSADPKDGSKGRGKGRFQSKEASRRSLFGYGRWICSVLHLCTCPGRRWLGIHGGCVSWVSHWWRSRTAALGSNLGPDATGRRTVASGKRDFNHGRLLGFFAADFAPGMWVRRKVLLLEEKVLTSGGHSAILWLVTE